MAENYVSNKIDVGKKIKDSLDTFKMYDPSKYVWKEITLDEVDLTNPTLIPSLVDPGNYVVCKYKNGPSEIPEGITPLLMTLNNGEICVTALGNSYIYNIEDDIWNNINDINTNEDVTKYIISDTEPIITNNVLWIDTSHLSDETNKYADLKYYDDTNTVWKSIYSIDKEKYLLKSKLDPDNLQLDIYQFIIDSLTEIYGDYDKFVAHTTDEKIHYTPNDLYIIENVLTHESAKYDLWYNKSLIFKNISKNLYNYTIKIDSASYEIGINSIDNYWYAYRWKNYYYGSSGMSYLLHDKIFMNTLYKDTNPNIIYLNSFNSKVKVNDLKISTAYMPSYLFKNYYAIEANTVEDEFRNLPGTEENRYNNGCGFWFDETDQETGLINRKWYRIIDSTKLGTDDWESGISEFTPADTRLYWKDIQNKPNSLKTLGITDEIPTKTTIDNDVYQLKENSTELVLNSEDIQNETYNINVTDSNWVENTIDNDHQWYKISYANKIWFALPDDASNEYAISSDGINWSIYTIPSSVITYDVVWFIDKYIMFPYYSTTFYYSADGITWTAGTLATETHFCSICVGEKYIFAFERLGDNFFSSTDGVNWEYSRFASDIRCARACYGNNTYVIVLSPLDSTTNEYKYSLNGTTWLTGTFPVSSQWEDVCYNSELHKFIAISNDKCVYSSNGTSWKECNLTTDNQFTLVTSGKLDTPLFIILEAIPYTNNTVAYLTSTNGISWSRTSLAMQYYIDSLSYGDGKFIGVDPNLNCYITLSSYNNSEINITGIGIQEITDSDNTNIFIKTSDGKIYQTTTSNKTTYDIINTTVRSSESIGNGLSEVYLKKYAKVISSEDTNEEYNMVVYDNANNIWYASGIRNRLSYDRTLYAPICYSYDGEVWSKNMDPLIKGHTGGVYKDKYTNSILFSDSTGVYCINTPLECEKIVDSIDSNMIYYPQYNDFGEISGIVIKSENNVEKAYVYTTYTGQGNDPTCAPIHDAAGQDIQGKMISVIGSRTTDFAAWLCIEYILLCLDSNDDTRSTLHQIDIPEEIAAWPGEDIYWNGSGDLFWTASRSIDFSNYINTQMIELAEYLDSAYYRDINGNDLTDTPDAEGAVLYCITDYASPHCTYAPNIIKTINQDDTLIEVKGGYIIPVMNTDGVVIYTPDVCSVNGIKYEYEFEYPENQLITPLDIYYAPADDVSIPNLLYFTPDFLYILIDFQDNSGEQHYDLVRINEIQFNYNLTPENSNWVIYGEAMYSFKLPKIGKPLPLTVSYNLDDDTFIFTGMNRTEIMYKFYEYDDNTK